MIFFSITVNLRKEREKWEGLRNMRVLECWNRFCIIFIF